MDRLNVVILGDQGVGKTALVVQLVLQRFSSEYNPTVQDEYRTELEVDGQRCLLSILDTSNMQEYLPLFGPWLVNRDGIILVYSISSELSFQRIRKLHDATITSSLTTRHVPRILIGNKTDDKRAVSTEEGLTLAGELGYTFFETSAKMSHNVNEPFCSLVRRIRSGARPMQHGEGAEMFSELMNRLLSCGGRRK